MPPVVSFADLPLITSPSAGPIAGRHLFEGASYGLSQLTVVVGESPPGQGVRLHRHTCDELIIVHAGRGTYTVGSETVEAAAGEIVVIPAGVMHRWVNLSDAPLVHTAVFPTGTLVVDAFED